MHNMPRLSRAIIAPAVALLLLGACTIHSSSYTLREPYPVRPARVEQAPRTQLPFPPGEWVPLIHRDNEPVGLIDNGISTDLMATRRIYGRVEDGRITDLAQFWTNTTSNGTPFGVSARCVQGNVGTVLVYAADIRGGQGSWDCVIADVRWFNGVSKTSTDLNDRLYAAAKPYGGIPKVAVRVEIAAAYQDNFLSLTLYHFPDREHVAGTWKPGQEGPAERAYVAKKLDEAQDFRPNVIKGVRNQL